MKETKRLVDQLEIVKSFSKDKDKPYRLIKGNVDYTPVRLTHKRFVEIKGAFDMSDFLSLFVCENFIPTNYPIFLNEDRSSLIKGLLTGSKYGPSTFPLKTILRREPKIGYGRKKKEEDTTPIKHERTSITHPVAETFQVSLIETDTISLFSQETSVDPFEIKEEKEDLGEAEEEAEEEEHVEEEVEEEGEEEGEEEEAEVESVSDEEVPAIRRTVRATKKSIKEPTYVSSEEEEEEQVTIDLEGLKLDEPFKDTGTNPEEPYYLEVAVNTDNPLEKNQLVGISPYIFQTSRPGVIFDEVIKKPQKYEDPRLIKADYEDISACVLDSPAFYNVFHTLEKILDSKHYRKEQIIYNNANLLDDLPKDQKFALIFTFKQPKKLKDKEVCHVTSLEWHPLLKYLIGVGYGKVHMEKKSRGMFCIWNIKNPSFPERMYNFKDAVTCFSFTKVFPYAVPLTFFNGQMMFINILARKLFKMCDNTSYKKDYLPITHIEWFKGERGDYYPVISSKSGDMYTCKVEKFFYSSSLLELPRKYGETKGIKQLMRIFPGDENAKPLKIGISTFVQHPKKVLIYLVGTDDGYIHVCSKMYRMKDTDVFAAHEGPITSIEFHRETDKLFLTTGNDYYVRVWAYLIYTPLICFTTKKELVRSAKWSTFNVMQIIAMGDIYLDVWDLRRINNSVPIATYENTERSNNLVFNLSPHGPHVIFGDDKGDVQLLMYNDPKFEPSFKMKILARALRNHVKCRNATLWRQVEELVPDFKVENIEDDNLDILECLDD